MQIPYEVIAQQPVDEDNTRVVVETLPPVVINGYGGGRITFIAPNDTIEETIEAHVAKKFTTEIEPQKRDFELVGKLDKIEHVIEAATAKREEAERVEAEENAKADGGADQSKPESPVDETPSQPSEPVVPPVVEEPAPQPPVVEPSPELPPVEEPAPVVQPVDEGEAQPLPKVEPEQPAEPFVRPSDGGGLGVEEKA